MKVTDLQPGQWLRTSTWVQVTAITRWTQQARVHNLTIDDIHTYYVIAGNTPVLVHNSNICLAAGKNFKPHFLKRKTLLQSATGNRYSTLAEGGPQFLSDLSDMVNNGTLEYVGRGTLKVGQPAGNIYRGKGLTLVTTGGGEFWTLLKSGEGLDKAIVMVSE